MLNYFVPAKHHMMIVNYMLVVMYILIISGFILRVLRQKIQGKVSHGTANIAKEKIVNLIKILAPSLSKTFSKTTLQMLQKFYVAIGIVTKTRFCYEMNLRI